MCPIQYLQKKKKIRVGNGANQFKHLQTFTGTCLHRKRKDVGQLLKKKKSTDKHHLASWPDILVLATSLCVDNVPTSVFVLVCICLCVCNCVGIVRVIQEESFVMLKVWTEFKSSDIWKASKKHQQIILRMWCLLFFFFFLYCINLYI